MSRLDGWIAKRNVDIRLLIGNHIDDITFTVTNKDGTAYDFTGASEFTIRIYKGNTEDRILEVTHTKTTGELTQSSNVITWNAAFPTALTFGTYFYELEWTNSSSEKIRLSEGELIVVNP